MSLCKFVDSLTNDELHELKNLVDKKVIEIWYDFNDHERDLFDGKIVCIGTGRTRKKYRSSRINAIKEYRSRTGASYKIANVAADRYQTSKE